MDAHRGIAVRRGCRWTGCRGAPGLGGLWLLGATSQARAAAPTAPLSPQNAAPTPLAWTRGPGVGQPLPCGTHGGQGAAVGLGGVRAAVCPLRARSVPPPCPLRALPAGRGRASTRVVRGPPLAVRPPLPARAVARCVTRPAVLPSRTEVPD